jgi:hypothetical protein
MDQAEDERWMRRALAAAAEAGPTGDVPVGALLVRAGDVVAVAANRTVRDQDATAHAEVLAVRAASRALGSWRLSGCTLYVTLEPCAMCAGALVLARGRPGRLRRLGREGRHGGLGRGRAAAPAAEPSAGGARRRARGRVRGGAAGLLHRASGGSRIR